MSKVLRETGQSRGRYEHSTPNGPRGLSDVDYQQVLEPRSVSQEQAAKRGYFSVLHGDLVAHEFSQSQADQTGESGVLIPLHNSQRVWGHMYRPHKPRTQIRENGKTRDIKYELPPGQRVDIDIAPGSRPFEEKSAEIWITEGPMKADALICAGADIAIGLFGVFGYRHAAVMAFLDRVKWEGRIVRIALDSDTGTNGQVALAAWRIGQQITARGGAVSWLQLPDAKDGSKQGVDDLLAVGETLDSLRQMVHPNPILFSFKRRTGAQGELLPLIVTNASKPFDERVREAERALVDANSPEKLFVRGGRLVMINRSDDSHVKAGIVTEHLCQFLMSESADYVQLGESRSEAWVKSCTPPMGIAKALLELPDIHVPRLRNLVFGPFMRPDFSVVSTPGYDAATEVYYVDTGAGSLNVPENPTQDDARSAAANLRELIRDFGLDAASQDNALAMIITPPLRTAIKGLVPPVSISKTNRGEGGGLLTDVASIIATGRTLPRSSFIFGDNNGTRQQITSTLLDGGQLAGLDNCDGELSSQLLETLFTAEVWKDRRYHTQSNMEIPNTACWIVNGIGLRPVKGLVRRFLPITLKSGVEHPDRREAGSFHIPDLPGHLTADRARYLADIFTMARAWNMAKRPEPKGLPAFASYEEWKSPIGGILQFAGALHFLENLYSFRESADEEATVVKALLSAWWDGSQGTKLTTAEVISRIDSESSGHKWNFKLSDLTPFMGDRPGDPVKKLPHFLGKLQGRVFSHAEKPLSLTITASTNNKSMKVWKLEATDMPKPANSESLPTTPTRVPTGKRADNRRNLSEVSAFGMESSSNGHRKSAREVMQEDIDEAIDADEDGMQWPRR